MPKKFSLPLSHNFRELRAPGFDYRPTAPLLPFGRRFSARHQQSHGAKRRIKAATSLLGRRLRLRQQFHVLINEIHPLMSNDLGANFARPKQQIGESVANFVLGKLGYLGDLFLRVRAATNGLAHAIRRREFSQHAGNPSR